MMKTCSWFVGASGALPHRRRHPAGHGGATLGSLDCLGGDGRCDVVGFVLGLGLEREKSTQLALDLGAVGAGLAKQDQHLVVVVAGGSLAEPGAAHRVGGVDAGVDG